MRIGADLLSMLSRIKDRLLASGVTITPVLSGDAGDAGDEDGFFRGGHSAPLSLALASSHPPC